MKKTLSSLVVAGAIVFSGFGATSATASYTPSAPPAVSDTTPAVGQAIPVTISGIEGFNGQQVTFTLTGTGAASIASIVRTAAVSDSVQKTVVEGSATATFTASADGAYTVAVTGPNGEDLGSVALTVGAGAGAGSGSGSTDGLPATGGEASMGAIWLGAGALGLGAIAFTAAAARRRAAAQN